MKVAIHISHSQGEDLAELQATASVLGFSCISRGGFMGKDYSEIEGEMSVDTLRRMLDAAAEVAAVAA